MEIQKTLKRSICFVLFMGMCLVTALPSMGAEFQAAEGLNSWVPGSPHVVGSFPKIGNLITSFKEIATEETNMAQELTGAEDPLVSWLHPFEINDVAFSGGLNDGVVQGQVILGYKKTPETTPWLQRIAEGKLSQEELDLWSQETPCSLVPLSGDTEKLKKLGHVYILNFDRDEDPDNIWKQAYLTARENLLILAYTQDNLLATYKALENPENRYNPDRKYPDLSSFIRFNDAGLTQIGLISEKIPAVFHDNIEGELAFGSTKKSWNFKAFSTLFNAFYTEEELAKITPVTTPTPLVGGGEAIAAAGINPDFIFMRRSLGNLLEGKSNPVAGYYNDIVELLTSIGFQEKDVHSILGGSYHFVIGGEAGSMFVPVTFPGVYGVLKGKDAQATQNVVETLAALLTESVGVPLEKQDLKGWDSFYALSMPVTAVLGAKGDELFLGLVDPNKIQEPSKASSQMKKMASAKDKVAWMHLDMNALDRFLFKILDNNNLWAPMVGENAGNMGHGILLAHKLITSKAKGFLLGISNPKEGFLEVLWGTPSKEEEKEWEEMKTFWEENFGPSFLVSQ